MKRLHRLQGEKEFKSLFKYGRRTDYPLFRVFIRPNKLHHARFAWVTPKAAAKHATVRNRIRRRAREFIRRDGLMLTEPNDFAFFFKKEAASAPRKKFYEELKRIMEQVGI